MRRPGYQVPRTIQILVAVLLLATAVWLIAPAIIMMTVGTVPYIHSYTFLERLVLPSTLVLGAYLVVVAVDYFERGRLTFFHPDLPWKDRLGAVLGAVFFVFCGALSSANTFGLLVDAFPGEEFKAEFEVRKAEYVGGRAENFVTLDLRSPQDGKMYYLNLSKRKFDYLHFRKGEPLILTGKRNLFGTLVAKYESTHYQMKDGIGTFNSPLHTDAIQRR